MKPDVPFALDDAGWSVLLVDGAGTIQRANDAARRQFGAALEAPAPRLGTIWASQNAITAEQFLATAETFSTRPATCRIVASDQRSNTTPVRSAPLTAVAGR